MKKTLLGTILAAVVALGVNPASGADTVRFWYHFDNADNPMSKLVDTFEAANPDIKIEAENIPWNSCVAVSAVGGSPGRSLR